MEVDRQPTSIAHCFEIRRRPTKRLVSAWLSQAIAEEGAVLNIIKEHVASDVGTAYKKQDILSNVRSMVRNAFQAMNNKEQLDSLDGCSWSILHKRHELLVQGSSQDIDLDI